MAETGDKRRKSALTGSAGTHFVVSELCRRGFTALPTIRNSRGPDVLVMNEDGLEFRVLQVKTTSRRDNFWLVGPRESIKASPRFFYIFVRPKSNSPEDPYEAFIVPSERVAREARDYGGSADDWKLPSEDREVDILRGNWNSLWSS